MACLDTTFFIDLHSPRSKHRPAATQKLADLVNRGELLATTRFNVAELFLGVHLAANKRKELQRVKKFLAGVQVLPFGRGAAWLFGKTGAYLRKGGNPIASLDLLIAVTALSTGHAIITRNPGHFARVPGLIVESY